MRKSKVERKTLETEITVFLNIDGNGIRRLDTGIEFYDHMLSQLAAHGNFDLEITVKSIDGDSHHIVEDTALALGDAFKQALGEKKGIYRYGEAIVPMDDSLSLCSIDLSGRPYCYYKSEIREQKVRDFETALAKHFFISFSVGSMSNVHVQLLHGEDPHHKIESMFKSFAKALHKACALNKDNLQNIPSTKGII